MNYAKQAFVAGKMRQLYMDDLRDQAIAAFLVTRIEELKPWLETEVQDSEIADACMSFIRKADSNVKRAREIIEFSQPMTALRAKTGEESYRKYSEQSSEERLQSQQARIWALEKKPR